MANKKSEDKGPRKALLVMPEDVFKNELEKGIDRGKDLLKIQVTRNSSPYGMFANRGYVSQELRQYNKEEIETFKKEYYDWTDYYLELLKQAFDFPDNEYQNEFDSAGISFLMGDEDVMEDYHHQINEKTAVLGRLIAKLSLIPKADTGTESEKATEQKSSTNKVFIVHGHDSNTRNEAELLVKQFDLDPVVLFKKPNMGDTIIEKLFRESKDVAFAIILYTKCDEGKAVEETDYKPRARQNVVFEHGLMCGLLGRKKVVALVEDGVEVPGDLSGVVYISLDAAKRWQFDLAREMKASGMHIDLNKLFE